MPWHNLSEFIPWILAIFFVLFMIACCSWLYRCIHKCDDQCPGILPTRNSYNPNAPLTPFPDCGGRRHTLSRGSNMRLTTTQRAANVGDEPASGTGGSGGILSSSSAVHYHGLKVPPYVSFADRPPPPSYEEACSSLAAASSTPATAVDDPADNTAQTGAASEAATVTPIPNTTTSPSVSNTTTHEHVATLGTDTPETNREAESINTDTEPIRSSVVMDESPTIDAPQDEPLINASDEEDVVDDVVVLVDTMSSHFDDRDTTQLVRSASCNV